MPLLGPSLIDTGTLQAAVSAIVDPSGNQLSTLAGTPPATATLTQVPASVTSVTILAANANRKKAIIFNNSAANLFLAFAGTASATAFTVRLAGHAEFETDPNGYTGIITGIWAAASGNAQVTEVTP